MAAGVALSPPPLRRVAPPPRGDGGAAPRAPRAAALPRLRHPRPPEAAPVGPDAAPALPAPRGSLVVVLCHVWRRQRAAELARRVGRTRGRPERAARSPPHRRVLAAFLARSGGSRSRRWTAAAGRLPLAAGGEGAGPPRPIGRPGGRGRGPRPRGAAALRRPSGR